MSIIDKMFGKSNKPGGIIHKIKEIREGNIERRESINRVKKAKELTEKHMHPNQIDHEAKEIAEKYGVSYKDALEYIKSERKSAARKESLRKIAGSLHEVGKQAREQTAQRMRPSEGNLIFEKPDLTKSKIFPRR